MGKTEFSGHCKLFLSGTLAFSIFFIWKNVRFSLFNILHTLSLRLVLTVSSYEHEYIYIYIYIYICVCVCVCVCVYFTLSKRKFCNYPEKLNPYLFKYKTYCWYTNC